MLRQSGGGWFDAGQRLHRRSETSQNGIEQEGNEEADKPGITVNRHEKGRELVLGDYVDCGQKAGDVGQDANNQGEQTHQAEAFGVAILAIWFIEIHEAELAFADEKIVGNHDATDGAEQSAVADQPGKNVTGRIGQKFPGHDQHSDDSGDETARSE